MAIAARAFCSNYGRYNLQRPVLTRSALNFLQTDGEKSEWYGFVDRVERKADSFVSLALSFVRCLLLLLNRALRNR